MNLVKLTRGNQVTIPKEIIEQAEFNPAQDYLSVEYFKGMILLKPVEIEESIPAKAYEKLLKRAFTIGKEDLILSTKDAKKILKKKNK